MRHSLVRNSKSEDQLAYDELSPHMSDEDKLNSSCHTLLDSSCTTTTLHTNNPTNPPFVSSESSSSRSAGGSTEGWSSGGQLLSSQVFNFWKHLKHENFLFQPSEEATSPDFSTSSLISCSEHYNGESLLDNLSPQSPSSPDTPEWSLIANGESFHKVTSFYKQG